MKINNYLTLVRDGADFRDNLNKFIRCPMLVMINSIFIYPTMPSTIVLQEQNHNDRFILRSLVTMTDYVHEHMSTDGAFGNCVVTKVCYFYAN